MKKLKNLKIVKIINKIINFDKKYNITIMSGSLSFYMIISIVSLFMILIQVMNISNNLMDSVLFIKLLSIFSEAFKDFVKDIFPTFKINNFTSISFITVIWSASCLVSSYNSVADEIYYDVKKRKKLYLKISSFLMFLMLLVILLFGIVILVNINYIIEKYLLIKSKTFVRFIEILLEYFFVFLIIIILNNYLPPIRMNFKKSIIGSIIASIFIYLVLLIYVNILSYLMKLNIMYFLNFIINSCLVVVFIINYIIILGIIINYKLIKYTENNKDKEVKNEISSYNKN